MIGFSLHARRAIAYLFRPYNDIDVYVEDVVSRAMYEILLGRALEGKAQVKRVIPLGDRYQVIAAATADTTADGRRRIYIIDGDLELVLNRAGPAVPRLFRLHVYAAENLVLTETSVSEVAYESLTNTPRKDVETVVGITGLFAELERLMVPLMATLTAVHQCAPEVATMRTNVMTLCSEVAGRPQLDEAKIRAAQQQSRNEALQCTDQQSLDAAEAMAYRRMQSYVPSALCLVPARQLLLPFVLLQLRHVARYGGNKEQLKAALARHVPLTHVGPLAKALSDAAAGRNM